MLTEYIVCPFQRSGCLVDGIMPCFAKCINHVTYEPSEVCYMLICFDKVFWYCGHMNFTLLKVMALHCIFSSMCSYALPERYFYVDTIHESS